MTMTGQLCLPIPRQATWLLKLATVLLVFGLGSTAMSEDTTPPTVSSVSPSDGATNVSRGITTVEVIFNEEMNRETYAGNIYLTDSSGGNVAMQSVGPGSTSYQLHLLSTLAPNETYTVHVTTDVQDLNGNSIAVGFTSSFTTEAFDDETTPPTVSTVSPYDGATNVSRGIATIEVIFSEEMNRETYTGNIYLTDSSGGNVVMQSVGPGSTSYQLHPLSTLAPNETYTVHVTTDVQDLNGNSIAVGVTSSFTTEAFDDETTPPTVSTVSPYDGATNVPRVITTIEVNFSEEMDRETYTGNIYLTDSSGGNVAMQSVGPGSTSYQLHPLSTLASNETYTVHVTTDVQDLNGNSIAVGVTSSFTTEDSSNDNDPVDGSGDDPPPLMINCPVDLLITCEDSIDAVNVAGDATADGGCPGIIDITHTDGGTGLGVCGTFLRTWIATDECLDSESCVQTITITGVEQPAFSCPPDVTLDCAIEETAGLYADPATGTTGYPDYTSSCGSAQFAFADVTILSNTCLTGIERTWTFTDSCGYSATCLQTISVNDVFDPIVDCPPDVTISCEASSDPDNTGYASVSDNCEYDPVTYYDISDPANGCDYPDNFITRRWLGTDKCGNVGTCLQQITRIGPHLSYWSPANGATDVRPETRLEFSINRAPTAMQIVPGYDETYSYEYEYGGRDGDGPDEEQVTYDLFVGQGTVTIEEFLDALNRLHADQPEKIQFRANGNMVFQYGGSPILLFDMDQNNSVTVTGIEEELFDNGITYNPTGEPVYDAAQARKNFPILGVTWYGAVYYCNWLTKRKKQSNERAYAIGSEPDDWRPASLTKAEWQDGFHNNEREAWIQQYPVSYRLPMDDYAETASQYNEFFHFLGDFGEGGENGDEMNYWNSGDFFDNGPVPPDYYDDNEFDLQNVLGNVWEWQTDTFAPQDLSARSLRGISWYNNPQLLDRLERIAADPESGFADVGFRVVSSVEVVFEVEIAENAEFTDSTVLTMSPEVPDLNGYYTNRSRELSLAPSTDYFWRVRSSHSPSGELDPVDLLFGARENQLPTPYATFRTSDQVREPALQLNLAGEWNLLSINVDPDPNVAHPKSLFGADSTAWGWDSEQQIYFRLYEIKPFEGFWIHVPEPGTVEVTGLTPDPEIEIRHGWNLLGPLNDDTPLPAPSYLRGEVLQYLNGGYESVDVFHTGFGYWMFFISDFVHDLSDEDEDEEAE